MTILEQHTERMEALFRKIWGPDAVARNLLLLTGGASKRTYSADVVRCGKVLPIILQLFQARGEESGEHDVVPRLTPEQDASIQTLMKSAGVAVPNVLYILKPDDGIGLGYITERISGESSGRRIIRDDRYSGTHATLARDCARTLAAIHTFDTEPNCDFLPYTPAGDLIARFKHQVDQAGLVCPALEWALEWLDQHIPSPVRTSVCHGDFRLGNFIVGREGLRAVIDWELANLGDPAQDIGWLSVRSWRFGGARCCGGFVSLEEFIEAYVEAGGPSISLPDVMYWQAFGNVRWALHCLRRGVRYLDRGRVVSLEDTGIGRRFFEPIHDFINLVEKHGYRQ